MMTSGGKRAMWLLLGILGGCGGDGEPVAEGGRILRMAEALVGTAALPAAPSAVRAVAGDASVQLLWSASADTVDSYTIERSTNGSSFSSLATLVVGIGPAVSSYRDDTSRNGSKYYYRVRSNAAGQSSNWSNVALATPSTALPSAAVSWPLAAVPGLQRSDADANRVRFQFGPRASNGYDFHAGIDLPAAEGSDVYAVAAGEVDAIGTWDGVSTGAGNFVRIRHQGTAGGEMKYTSYLHLSSVSAGLHVADPAAGIAASRVEAATLLGKSGRTGASWAHLHFTYMVGSSGGSATSNAEKRAKNPLEILPHSTPVVSGIFNGDTAEFTLASNLSTVRWIVARGVADGTQAERVVDYYAVVDQGDEARNISQQSGLQLDATAPVDGDGRSTKGQGNFTLKVSAGTEATYRPMRLTSVKLIDERNTVLAEAARE